jgi:hypothetical protein
VPERLRKQFGNCLKTKNNFITGLQFSKGSGYIVVENKLRLRSGNNEKNIIQKGQ